MKFMEFLSKVKDYILLFNILMSNTVMKLFSTLSTQRMGRHVRGMKLGTTGGKRDSLTGIFPGQLLIRGRYYLRPTRIMKTGLCESFREV